MSESFNNDELKNDQRMIQNRQFNNTELIQKLESYRESIKEDQMIEYYTKESFVNLLECIDLIAQNYINDFITKDDEKEKALEIRKYVRKIHDWLKKFFEGDDDDVCKKPSYDFNSLVSMLKDNIGEFCRKKNSSAPTDSDIANSYSSAPLMFIVILIAFFLFIIMQFY